MSKVTCIWDAKALLGEGVIWHPDENAVYWLDIVKSVLYRLDESGNKSQWQLHDNPSAIVPCRQGGLLATNRHGVCHIDTGRGAISKRIGLESELASNRFNDGTSDALGQFWFASMDDSETANTGAFYRLTTAERVECVDVFGKACITNGPAISTCGSWIFFTDTLEKKIFRAPLNKDGSPGKPMLFIDFTPYSGYPDGMCTDSQGGLWVCHFGGGRITRFNESGASDTTLMVPVPNVTKCTFGGNNMQTLYITTAAKALSDTERERYPLSGGLFSVDVPFSGRPAYHVNDPSS